MQGFRTERSETVRRIHANERTALAWYAMHTEQSRGRRHPEPPHCYRTEYQRDRDRIIHSAAFRRLMYKTQVFVGQPDDHQRSRLTHTLEVAQIARTVARALRLNEDLTETIALAHDLGHPPFGHAGERALQALMAGHGGFEHNRHGLRLMTQLEHRYPGFPGLNLSHEVLESIALRCKDASHPAVREFEPDLEMLAESQVVDVCDSIAYDTHDIDDAIRAGLIGFDDLRQTMLWREAEARARQAYGQDLDGKQLTRAVIRSLIDWQVSSVIEFSGPLLEACGDPEAVKRAGRPLVAIAPEIEAMKSQLEQFLFDRVYRHEQVVRTTRVAERMIAQIFEELVREPTPLPERFRRRLDQESPPVVVCDYVAGMTDRFAQSLHRRLFEP